MKTTTLPQAVAQAILNARKRLGLSQEELAHRADLDRTYISGIERGVRNITLNSLGRVVGGLEMDMTTFLQEVVRELTV